MLNIIAAVAENGVIGDKNKLLWHIPEDLQRFKKLTMGKTVVMGRKTFESILEQLGTPLPGRKNVVITRQNDYITPGVEIFHSIDEALQAHQNEDIWIIGGGQLYAQTIDKADKLYITHVEKTVSGDTYFPTISPEKWKLASEEKFKGYRFSIYERK